MAPESRDEVRQRIASLYDQAENDTGNFNATRAMAARTRSRGVPLAKRAGRRPDPALDEVARQWFDAVRASLGPTVPAVLPADRLPDRPAAPARSRERMERLPLPGGEREVRALPGGGSEPLGLPSGGSEALGLPGLPGGGGTRALPGGERRALGMGGRPEQRPAALEPGTGQAVAELTTGSATDPTSGSLPTGSVQAGSSRTGFLPTGSLQTQTASLPTGSLPVDSLPTGSPSVGSPPTGSPSAGSPSVGSLPAPETGRAALVDAASSSELPGAVLELSGDTLDTAGWNTAEPAGWNTAEPAGWSTAEPAGWDTAAPAGWDTAEPAGWDTAEPVSPAVLPVAAQPAVQRAAVRLPRTLPGSAGFVRLSPTASKAGLRRKLDTARDLLSGRTARLGLPDTTVQPAPVLPDRSAGAQQMAQPAMTSTVQWQQQGAEPVLSAAPMAGALPAGITAPVTDTGSFSLPLPASAPVESPRALRAAKAIAFARAQLGKPCVWGATGPDSYDCSSLTQAAWKAAGVTLPRAAHEQALAGTPLTTAGLEPGDLVLFFEDDRHVGLYVGDGNMVHAPGPGSSIREESIYGAGEAAIHRIIRPA
ncbi:NlpC/P60 family protein [Streptomyces sp. NPDC052721]|uniref:NlpC/P60 family protein n=1 Tax=Streptomyces sp. NPDC052721 TaxID=3154955 RepID=UPI003423A7F8